MNKEQMQARLAEVLSASETETDVTKLSALVEEGESLQKQLEVLGRRDALKSVVSVPSAPGISVAGGDNLKRVGVDILHMDDKGSFNAVEQIGGGIGEKAWQAISEPSYKNAFMRYAANPNMIDSFDMKTLAEAKNFQEGLDPAGGFLIPADMQMEIVRRDPQLSGVLDLVRTLPTASDRMLAPRLDYTGASDDTAGDIFTNPMRLQWTGEAAPPGSTVRPDLGQIEVPVYEGMFEMPFSRAMADDGGAFFGDFLTEELRNAYRLGMENVVINGDGVAKPTGLLANVGGVHQPPTQNVGNPVTADGLTDWIYSLPPQYDGPECRWLTNRTDVFRTWAKIKDSANNYIFGLSQNISGGLATERGNVLFGYNGAFSPFMPNSGSAANVGIFGNFRRAYWLVQRLGMTVMFQDIPRERFRYAVVRYRVGGAVVQGRALRVAVQS
jgi:HK97 family phage major capsid protein